MRNNFSKWGKLGAKKFWKMYKEDPQLRAKIRKSREKRKGTIWIKEASRKGVETKRKKRVTYERSLEKKISDKMQKINNHTELSRLCGFLAGDGSVSIRRERNKNATHYDIRFYPDDIHLANLFVKTFKRFYEKEPHIKKLKNHFCVRVSSKVACEHLLSITSLETRLWKVPNKLFTSEESTCEFIRAFFDCEAYVGKKNIQVQSVNYNGLSSIKDILKSLEIPCKIYEYKRKNLKWKTNYILTISRRENLRKYNERIGFNHPVKKSKLNKLAGVPER